MTVASIGVAHHLRAARDPIALLLIVALLALAGCGGSSDPAVADTPSASPPPASPPSGGGTPGGGTPPPAAPLSVEASLVALGFDTRITPRRDSEGIAYPKSYSPFGARVALTERADGTFAFGQPTELVLAGFRLRSQSDVLYTIDHLANPTVTNPPAPTVLHRRSALDLPWLLEQRTTNDAPQTRRAAAAADIDGDGLQELVLAHVDGSVVRLIVRSFKAGGSEASYVVPAPPGALPLADLRVAAADFDQDGRDELVVAVAGGGPTSEPRLLVLGDVATGPVLLKQLALPRRIAGSSVSMVLKTGSVDYDGASELAVVVNELLGGLLNPTQAAAHFYVFDDRAADHALMKSGPIEASIDGRIVTAKVGDIAIGDLDNDQAGEIVMAGLAEFNTACQMVEHLLIVLDDGVREFRPKSASAARIPIPECDDSNANRLRHAYVNLLDVDGDEDLEIQVNEYVFQAAPASTNWDASQGLRRLASSALFPQGARGAVFDRSNSAMTVADVDGDGRQDIVSFRQGNEAPTASGFVAYIDIYGANEAGTFGRIGRIELTPEANQLVGINPIIVAIAPDADCVTLEYENDHELVFTEAMVHAALAAPPCALGIGQNTDACATTWGQTQSTGIENERELRIEAGVAGGFKWQGGPAAQSERSLKVKISGAASFVKSESYELSKSVSFTTGPLEDSVVFSSVPLDAYTYRVIVHPNPARIGSQISIALPRTPTVRLAERSYYNAHLPAGSPKIGPEVFEHTPGSIGSYPNASRRDQILAERRAQVDDNRVARGPNGPLALLPVFDRVPAELGLYTEAPGVGQGGGATSVSLELNQENGVGRSLEVAIEIEYSSTKATRIFEFSLGFSSTWTWKVTHGEGSAYEGSVGSIDAANFAAQQYRFGLFTYLQADPASGREFEVVNYWVER